MIPSFRRFTVAAVATALASGALPPSTSAANAPARPPNILLIVADDLGYGDLGCYGQARIRTPHLDRLAADGMRFTQFYAGSPVCAPSRNVLMTGRHVGRVLVRGNAKIDLRSAPEDLTVAETLRNAGYATGLIGKWGLGREGSTGAPRAKGWDHFFGYVDQTHAHNHYPHFLVRNEERVPLRNVVPEPGPFGQGVATEKIEYAADLFADEALGFMERHRAQPFFLFYATTLPHANNEAGDAGMEIPDHGAYAHEDWPAPQKGLAAMITRLDQDVGRLLAKLDELGLAHDTLVLFTSDNGPHREGGNDPEFFDSNGPLRGFKRDLHEGGIRVPLLVRWPGRVPAGSLSNHPAYFGDFFATATEAAGIAPPAGLDSISFLPAALGRATVQSTHEFLYWEFYEGGSSQAVRFGDWKAVRAPMLTGGIQLFNLATDVGEQHDVAAQHPELAARARAFMERAHTPSEHFRAPAARDPNASR